MFACVPGCGLDLVGLLWVEILPCVLPEMVLFYLFFVGDLCGF